MSDPMETLRAQLLAADRERRVKLREIVAAHPDNAGAFVRQIASLARAIPAHRYQPGWERAASIGVLLEEQGDGAPLADLIAAVARREDEHIGFDSEDVRNHGAAHVPQLDTVLYRVLGIELPEELRPKPVEPEHLPVVELSAEILLGPIPEVRYLIEGMVPCEAYTLLAGALSAGKTTAAMSLAIWRATGEDVLGLNHGELMVRAAAGPVSYITYEDSESIIRRRLMIIVQAMHRQIEVTNGRERAALFIDNLVKHLRIIHLTGQPGAQLVVRSQYGQPEVNRAQIDALVATLKAHAATEHLIVLDPLRLAFSGSQNDDNGADLVVMVLNDLSTRLRDSALLVLSHVTKAMAADQGNNRVALAYGTAGSGVYSQHARSNMHMGRMEPRAIADLRQRLAEGSSLSDEEQERRAVTTLTHARLSHEAEGADAHFVMRHGLLIPLRLAERTPESAMTRLRREWPVVAEAIQRIEREGGRVSPETLQGDSDLRQGRTRQAMRDLIAAMTDQGWIAVQGNTRNRVLTITDDGREILGGNAAGIDGAA